MLFPGMYYLRMLFKEVPNDLDCTQILPPYVNDPSIQCEITQCMCKGAGGCCMMNIIDPEEKLADEIYEHETYVSENGECSIERISRNKFLAMVINNKCVVSRIISESGCLLISSRKVGPSTVSFGVVSGRKSYLYGLLEKLKSEGFNVEKESSSFTAYDSILTHRQEETLRVALENGYYDIPKKINTEGLAKKLNCTRSTVNTTLRNGEKKLIQYYMTASSDSYTE